MKLKNKIIVSSLLISVLLLQCAENSVTPKEDMLLLQIKTMGALGFCPNDGEILEGSISKIYSSENEFKTILRGTALLYVDLLDSLECYYKTGEFCIVKKTLNDIELSTSESDDLIRLMNAIPSEIPEPRNHPCDPCIKATYTFSGRTENYNPCNIMSNEYRESFNNLRLFVIDLVNKNLRNAI